LRLDQLRFPVLRLGDGRALINLGSSARVSPGWNNVDFSWLVRLGKHQRLCAWLHQIGLLNEQRFERILKLDRNVICWDLRRGIPFPDQTFDTVYHSHVLEHIDREDAPSFLRECFRVLKRRGILRVVVPDLELLAREYLGVVDNLPERATMPQHTFAVEQMIDQMVIRTPRHRALQHPVVQLAERLLVGRTDHAGILHRWMYDRFSAGQALREAGFEDVQVKDPLASGVPGWRDFNLDTEPNGKVYAPFSLYIEGRRPPGTDES
jgi:predicted SAM-dependent methyltransferase